MDERLDDGVAGFEDRDRPANCSGLGGQHRIGEIPQRLVVIGIPARRHLDTHLAVFGFPGRHQFWRQRRKADGLSLQGAAKLIEHDQQRPHEYVLGLFPRRRIGGSELGEIVRQPARCDRARSLLVASRLAQALRGLLQGGDILRVGRCRVDLIRVDCRIENTRAVGNQFQLGLLIIRHEAVERHGALDLRKLFQLGFNLLRIRLVRSQHVDGIGARIRILAQIEIGGDRFHFRVAQMDRVEIETQEVKQRQSGDHQQQRSDDDADAMILQKTIHRRQEGVADRFLLASRIEQVEQGRQHRDAGKERYQHADAGDLAKFRHALVIRRQE